MTHSPAPLPSLSLLSLSFLAITLAGCQEPNPSSTRLVYVDQDGDGFGGAAATIPAGEPTPAGYTSTAGDCDDTNPNIHPDAAEVCGGLDDDCDELIDEDDDSFSDEVPTWYADLDGDRFGDPSATVEVCVAPAGYVAAGEDCNDDDPAIHPGAQEVCSGVDDDCDGLIDHEDDTLALVNAVVGYLDLDGDGYGGEPGATCDDSLLVDNGDDCDDSDPEIYPGAPERCNGLDDDCDGFDDTLGYWPFDEGEGDVVVSDGGLELEGLITNATWTDGVDGSANSALEFHGNSYVTILNEDDALLPEHGLTVSVWVRPSSFDATGWDTIVSLGTAAGYQDTFWLGYQEHRATWILNDPGVDYDLLDPDTSTSHLGNWHNLMATWNSESQQQSLYIDGEAITLSPMAGPAELTSFGGPLRIGADTNGVPVLFFNGTIDEVVVLSCAVTDDELLAVVDGRWPL